MAQSMRCPGTGNKEQDSQEKDERFYRMERSYGTFVRSLRVPATLDEKMIAATFRNGVPTITLPKAAEAKALTNPVKTD